MTETDPRQSTENAVRDALRGVPNLRSGRLPDHGDAYQLIEALRVAGYVVTPVDRDTLDSLTAERAEWDAALRRLVRAIDAHNLVNYRTTDSALVEAYRAARAALSEGGSK